MVEFFEHADTFDAGFGIVLTAIAQIEKDVVIFFRQRANLLIRGSFGNPLALAAVAAAGVALAPLPRTGWALPLLGIFGGLYLDRLDRRRPSNALLTAAGVFGFLASLLPLRRETLAEGDYILRRILEIARLRLEDVQVIDLPLNRHLEAYREKEVDAVITFDPVRIQILSTGARELFSTRSIASEIMDVLVVREETIRTRPRAISKLVNGHFQAVERIRAQPATAAQAVAPGFGSAGEVLEAWRLIEFQGRIANQRLLSEGGILPVMERVHTVVFRTRLQGRKLDAATLVDDRFVRSAQP